MAVVCESAAGWLLDELTLINKWYQLGGALGFPSQPQKEHDSKPYYRLRDDLFRLSKPYYSVQPSPAPTETCALESDSRDNSATTSVRKISDFILEGSQLLIEEGLKKGLLHSPSGTEEEKCKIVSEVYGSKRSLADLCDMTKDMPCVSFTEYTVNVLDTGSPFSQDGDYLSRITENASDCPQIIHLMGEQYLIPPRSSFLLSDISYMVPLLHYKKYSVIVVDPPWENKSVKRSKRYNSLSPLKMKELPIPALAAPDCLVITWVTNRQKHLRFVKEELYPHWSIRSVAEWHWVKITQSGEFVFPIDSVHKKPYEILVVGRFMSPDNSTARELETVLPPIPEHKIIVSVPCSLHSHKPPLSDVITISTDASSTTAQAVSVIFWSVQTEKDADRLVETSCKICASKCNLKEVPRRCTASNGLRILGAHVVCLTQACSVEDIEVLKEYVKPDVERLELFARNLQPGWTSWGNEVLKFQHMDYFISSESGN